MFRQLQIYILKVYKNQNTPMIMFREEAYSKKNNIIFGSLCEPAGRYLNFYRINPFENGNIYFFTRSDLEYFEGFSEVIVQSISRKKYLGITAFAPSVLCNYLERTRKLLGARYLFFAGYEILTKKYKLGINSKEQFFKYYQKPFNKLSTNDDENLNNLNQYMLEQINNTNLLDPRQFIQNDSSIYRPPFRIYPIECGSKKSLYSVISYLVETEEEQKWDNNKLKEDKFPLALIPELKKFGVFHWQNQKFNKEDYLIKGISYLHLILDLKQNEIAGFDFNRLKELVLEKESTGKFLSLIVFHLGQKDSLNTNEYEQLVEKIDNISQKLRVCHIIADDRFYHNDGSSSFERDKVVFRNLQSTAKFSSLMPKIFQKPQKIETLHEKTSDDQTNLDELWPNLLSNKLLYRKTYALEHDNNGDISFEKSYKLLPQNYIITEEQSKCISQSYERFMEKTQNIVKGRLRLEFLGVAATLPTLVNNIQSFCLKIDSKQPFRLLIDCGSNTYYQLFCMHGDQLEKVLGEIKMIAITHFHSDHHLGLVTLIAKMLPIIEKQNQGPLVVLLPENLIEWYNGQIFSLVKQYYPQRNESDFVLLLTHKEYNTADESHYSKQLLAKQKIILDVFSVFHCFYSSGYKVTDLETNKTICFSSDHDGRNLQIDKVFLNYAKDSDILVHECTYPDFELSRAEEVNHSTFTQAINIGRRVGAKNLILTHYSPSCLKYIGDIINMDGSINEGKYKDFFNKFYPQHQTSATVMIDYLVNRTVFAQDLMGIDVHEVNSMQELSRIIMKHSAQM